MKKSNSRREKLLSEIAVEEQRLAALHSEVVKQRARLVALRDELNTLAPEQADVPLPLSKARTEAESITNAEKVALFRTLFRGRVDVFPRRWENPKTGRSGYSPACANEWDFDPCDKKQRAASTGKQRATCGECRNQAFLPVNDTEIVKHRRLLRRVRGNHRIPLRVAGQYRNPVCNRSLWK